MVEIRVGSLGGKSYNCVNFEKSVKLNLNFTIEMKTSGKGRVRWV